MSSGVIEQANHWAKQRARANGRVSGPTHTSGFLVILDHSALELLRLVFLTRLLALKLCRFWREKVRWWGADEDGWGYPSGLELSGGDGTDIALKKKWKRKKRKRMRQVKIADLFFMLVSHCFYLVYLRHSNTDRHTRMHASTHTHTRLTLYHDKF